MGETGKLPAQALEALEVQAGINHPFSVRGLGQDQPPGVHDEGAAVAAPAGGVLPPLGGGYQVGQVFDGPGPQQHLPVVPAGGHGEGRGQQE